MICPKCKAPLRVEQTLSSPAGKVQRMVCTRRGCPATFVSVVLLVQEINPGTRGGGAHAVMKKLKAGKLKVNVAN